MLESVAVEAVFYKLIRCVQALHLALEMGGLCEFLYIDDDDDYLYIALYIYILHNLMIVI